MNNENILLAKEIFMKYGGSHFHMEREGEYEYYKSFRIPKEQEQLWTEEYLKEMLNKIEAEDIVSLFFSEFTSTIRRSKNVYYLKKLLELIKKKKLYTDSFSQMIMAEELLRIVESFSEENNDIEKVKIINDAKHLALDILNGITKKPINVASYYKNIGYLQDVIQEDKIISRVQKLIERWKK